MQVELEAAIEDGAPLRFAIGCLIAAWREMPAHMEGRFTLASHVIAIGLIVPLAALIITGIWLGSGVDRAFVNDGNRASLSSLGIILLVLGAGQLRLAWLMLERDWVRVAAMAKLGAAATTTLILFTTVLPFDEAGALAQAAVLSVELAAVAALAHWHARLSRAAHVPAW